jgi:hypothetical protein
VTTDAVAVRCSVAGRDVGEPLPGTAPHATAWIALEQPGPWGAEALTESHLDPRVGRELGALVDGTGVRVLLTRRPGHHADLHQPVLTRTVWIASTLPGALALRRWDVDDPRALLDLDVAAIARGELPDIGVADEQPLLLVCTNAKRDRCCAITARPAVEAAAARHPGRVWECSHLGGHRFAPTALLLPHGYVLGRLDGARAGDALDQATLGLVDPLHLRGRSTWPAAGQAAECAVRRERRLTGLSDVTQVTVEPVGPDAWSATVRAGGRVHDVTVGRTTRVGTDRPESCGAVHAPFTAFDCSVDVHG